MIKMNATTRDEADQWVRGEIKRYTDGVEVDLKEIEKAIKQWDLDMFELMDLIAEAENAREATAGEGKVLVLPSPQPRAGMQAR